MRRSVVTASVLALSLLVPPVVRAAPGITLARGGVTATVTTEINASKDAAGEPVSIAPDVAYGVTDDLTLSLVHSTFATTGFRGAAGGGLCVVDACANVYDNAGLEALYGLVRGPWSAGVVAGVMATSFDRGWVSAKLGGRVRAKLGVLTLASAPSMFVALSHRDDAAPNRDRLYVPVSALVRVVPELSLGVGTGVKAPLDDVGDGWELAAGVLAQVPITRELTAGASWVHGKILGGDAAIPDGASGLDFRAIHVWLTYAR